MDIKHAQSQALEEAAAQAASDAVAQKAGDFDPASALHLPVEQSKDSRA